MLVDASKEYHRAGLRAILLRRSYPELEKSLIRRSRELYSMCGGMFNEQKRRWTFPSGATIEFGYCESEKDIYRYQGAEYTFIGFDESTHFTEFPIRYMLSRLRSTDPGMRLRMRLATNPGNIGHNTHKAIFQGPTCTHCQVTPLSRQHNVLYHDAVWPSDQHPIGKSTCFIPGRLTDHTLLGADYSRSLASLPGAFRKALLEGCWDVYEGQYFDHWDPAVMTMPRRRIEPEPWWPHWVGIDYGFNISQAAAYLLCKSPGTAEHPNGVTYVLEEYTAKHQPAVDFARELQQRFAGGPRQISGWYLSPDAWNQRGDGHTLADQMQEATRLTFEPASTDRVGGAMLIYCQLDRGELVVAESCRQLCEALPTRIHASDRPDDIAKIVGDPLDDCMDALRYAVYSYIGPARRPSGLERQAMITSPDPTVAMLQRRATDERWKKLQEPGTYVASRRTRR
ncbi:MAG TPA: terminase family protein [Terriglobales bacterium]|nr:terminase family protein [Terriglobales bacterium]